MEGVLASADIARHKTAIRRNDLSRPIKLAMMDGLLSSENRLFDYGCGRGDDLRLLASVGIKGAGWDPVHRPHGPREPAEIVNLGYVVNVIENPRERQETLKQAWSLAERLLIVSARLSLEENTVNAAGTLEDGCLTSRGTFQKFYEQHELKNWIESSLGTPALPAAPGVFYVFREEEKRLAFQASRYRRRIALPPLAKPEELFDKYQELLSSLMDFVAERGRLPADDEIPNAAALRHALGSIPRAFRVIESATGKERWNEITDGRAQDTLIYLGLSRFDGRPNFSALPRPLQLDVKSFFSSYSRACELADALLFSLGDKSVIDEACRSSKIGKLTPDALYVHDSAVDYLSPVLRLFEGCARGYIGQVEGANVIKLSREEPRVSYLSYPGFEDDPHPVLAFSMGVHLQTFRIRLRDYSTYRNPPILHRKETFVSSDHPLHSKFARLTRVEESKGLFENARHIGTREGWERALQTKGLYLKGHRLLRLQISSEDK